MEHWPHSPVHRILNKGTYMITGATFEKVHYFKTSERLKFLQDCLLHLASVYGWQLQAWVIFSNHYHFIAKSPEDPTTLNVFLSNLHVMTARHINELDKTLNRKVWWQYWDSQITYPYSYFARLNYINQNPVRHGLVKEALYYPWSSAVWFKETSPEPFYKTISTFKIDTVKVMDDF